MRRTLPSIKAGASGLKAAALWTGIEFAIREGLAAIILIVAVISGYKLRDPLASDPLGAHGLIWPFWAAVLVLGAVFRRVIIQSGLTRADLGYRFHRESLIVGAVVGLLGVGAVIWITDPLDTYLFQDDGALFEEMLRTIVRSGPLTVLGLVVANGILGPIVEEFAWRGYIQHRLTAAWGTRVGVGATALLFAGKHMIVDLSISRSVTLVLGAILLGVVRQRWGTWASTGTHVTENFVVTLLALFWWPD